MEETFKWPDLASQALDEGAVDEGLTEAQIEAEELANLIEKAIRQQTSGGVRDLSVEVHAGGVMLKGRCDTFYCKQLAQHAAMTIPGGDRLTNDIAVR